MLFCDVFPVKSVDVNILIGICIITETLNKWFLIIKFTDMDCLYMKHPHWCNNHKIYHFFNQKLTHNFWTILLYGNQFRPRTQGLHQAMIQECECIQKLNTISWRSPPFTLKYIELYEQCTRVNQLQKGLRMFKKCFCFLKTVFKNTKPKSFHRVKVM